MNLFKSKTPTWEELSKKGGYTTKNKYSKEHFQAIGRKGGAKLKQKRGEEYFKNLSRMGIEARKKNKNKNRNTENDLLDALTGAS